jgi:hypothetical protein
MGWKRGLYDAKNRSGKSIIKEETMADALTIFKPGIIRSIMIFSMLLWLTSCADRSPQPFQPEYTEPHFIKITGKNFDKEVKQYPGFVLVLFYNTKYEPSLDMEKRFEYFSARFGKTIKFCKFHWDIKNDRTPYDLKMLPTVDLYENGYQIDRIKGIPEFEEERIHWNDDIDLWIMKNVYKKRGNEYSAEFVYKFKDSAYLNVGNY